MVDVRTAVDSAAQYAKDWLGTPGALLEEVEPSKHGDREVWLVTLSIPRRYPSAAPVTIGSSVADLLYGNREFKVFEVDGETGLVRSMRMREMPRSWRQ
jgi:hypothetical protein